MHDLAVELRPVVHGRFGLRTGDDGELVRHGLLLRNRHDQRGRSGGVQCGRCPDPRRIACLCGRGLPVSIAESTLLSTGELHAELPVAGLLRVDPSAGTLRLLFVDPAGIPALIDAIRHLHDCGAKVFTCSPTPR